MRTRSADPPAGTPYREAMAALERGLVGAALEACGWNLTHTAQRLAIPISTLKYRIQHLGLRRSDDDDA